jgi:hypothetical protein
MKGDLKEGDQVSDESPNTPPRDPNLHSMKKEDNTVVYLQHVSSMFKKFTTEVYLLFHLILAIQTSLDTIFATSAVQSGYVSDLKH